MGANAPGDLPPQVLLLLGAQHHERRGRQRPRHQGEAREARGRRGPVQAAHRPADRAPVPGAGGADRPPHGRKVPRPARRPSRPDAEARMNQIQQRPLDVSVLIPAKDEAENLPELARLCGEALGKAGFTFEVVVVDDGSTDATPTVLAELEGKYPFLRHVTHRQRRGIADALRSGADAARGDVLVFYPGDLQYLPEDIPRLVAPILKGEAD